VYGYYAAVGGAAITGNMDQLAAERAAAGGELVTVEWDRPAGYMRPWFRPNGPRFRDPPGHRCALHEDLSRPKTWQCPECGKAYSRDMIMPSKYAWIRDPIFDAPWRDGGLGGPPGT